MNNKPIGIKEQVKRGVLPIADAMNRVSPQSKTYGWLLRRSKLAKGCAK